MRAIIQRDGRHWHVAFYRHADGRLWKLYAFTGSCRVVVREVVTLLSPAIHN